MKQKNTRFTLPIFCFLLSAFVINIGYIIIDLHLSAKRDEQQQLKVKIDRALELGMIFDQEPVNIEEASAELSEDLQAAKRFRKARNYWKADPNLPDDLKRLLIANLARVLFENPDDIPAETENDKKLQEDLRISMNELEGQFISEENILDQESQLSPEVENPSYYNSGFLSN